MSTREWVRRGKIGAFGISVAAIVMAAANDDGKPGPEPAMAADATAESLPIASPARARPQEIAHLDVERLRRLQAAPALKLDAALPSREAKAAPKGEAAKSDVKGEAAKSDVKGEAAKSEMAKSDVRGDAGKVEVGKSGTAQPDATAGGDGLILDKSIGDAFAPTSWYVPPPPPKPLPPPKPTAPPLPFSYIGTYRDQDGPAVVMLVKGDRLYTVSEGDVIEGTYRVERVGDGLVELDYLPLHEKQALRTGDAG